MDKVYALGWRHVILASRGTSWNISCERAACIRSGRTAAAAVALSAGIALLCNVQNVPSSSSVAASAAAYEHFEQIEQGPPALHSAPVVPIADFEPGLNEPCTARRGECKG
jgi:hypothetical protein